MSTNNSIDLGGLSKQYAARDLPGQLKMKYREPGQAAPEEAIKDKKDLKKHLEERERVASGKESSGKHRLAVTDRESASTSAAAEKPTSSKKAKVEAPVNLDADEVLPDDDEENEEAKNSDDSGSGSDDDDDDDDDDDTEALMAELNRIKQERAAEAARQEAERKAREEKIRVENILKGNPLLNPTAPKTDEFKVKRRWDDDVVFKNCAKADDGKKKDYINDTLRSEFHKKFMDRYIK